MVPAQKPVLPMFSGSYPPYCKHRLQSAFSARKDLPSLAALRHAEEKEVFEVNPVTRPAPASYLAATSGASQ